MADANGLLEAIKRAAQNEREASKPVNVCFGEVISVSPLKINVEQKMDLSQEQLVLTRNVTDYMTTVSVQWDSEEEKVRHKHKNEDGTDTEYTEIPHTHSIVGQKNFLMHNALEIGDEVILIRQQEGQKYIVLDRIGGKK